MNVHFTRTLGDDLRRVKVILLHYCKFESVPVVTVHATTDAINKHFITFFFLNVVLKGEGW